MRKENLATAFLLLAFSFFFSCSKNSTVPMAPAKPGMVSVAVQDARRAHPSFLGAAQNELLYKVEAPGFAGIKGKAGPFSTSSGGGSVQLNLNITYGRSYLLSLQLNDAGTGTPLAIGAGTIDLASPSASGVVTIDLGSVVRECYIVDGSLQPAVFSYGFNNDDLTGGVTTTLPFDITLNASLSTVSAVSGSNGVAFLGNGDLVDFDFVPPPASFQASHPYSAVGDIFCVQLLSVPGGHAWMQITDLGGATGPSFRFRTHSSLPYFAQEPSNADLSTGGLCGALAFSPTPTSTSTLTSTISPTPSMTQTSTIPPTATLSSTATLTPTPTLVPTGTATSTSTGTHTSSSTPTDTRTSSPTDSTTPTSTQTATDTLVFTATSTASATPTATMTSTATSSETPTETPTVSSTPTPTATASVSSTPSSTATPTASPSETPTDSTTPTSTQTATDTLASTATSTATASPSSTSSSTATPTDTSTNSPTPTNTDSSTPTPSATLTESSTPTSSSTATPTATNSMTPTATLTSSLTASSTPTSTPTATSTDSATPTATPTDSTTPTLTATVTSTSTPVNTSTSTSTSSPTATRTATNTRTETPVPTPLFELKDRGSFPPRGNHSSVVFNLPIPQIWIIGGWDGVDVFYDDVFASPDGKTWMSQPGKIERRYGHTSLVYDDKQPPGSTLWVLGGHDGQDATNTAQKFNGDTWTTYGAEFPPRFLHASVVFDPTGVGDNLLMWVIGGDSGTRGNPLNDVWASNNGIAWTPVTQDKFPPRSQHAAVVADLGTGPRIYIFGGFDGGVLSDVWSSDNGTDWQRETDLPFGGRYGMTVVVDSNRRIWLIGGTDDSRVYNDYWVTTDLNDWTQVTDLTTDADRFGHTSVVFDADFTDQVWAIGGFNKLPFTTPLDDVWSSKP